MSDLAVVSKWVDAQWAATRSVCVDGIAELAKASEAATSEVGPAACGPAVARLLGRDANGRFRVEIAVPVPRAVVVDGFDLHEIPGDHVLATTHVGAHVGDGEDEGLGAAAQRLWGFVAEKRLLAGDNPTRYVFLEGRETHGDALDRYRTEIQVSYHLPVWLNALKQGVTDAVGERAATTVIAGSDEVAASFDAEEIRGFVLGAVGRVDELPVDAAKRACLLQDCAHRYPRLQLDRLRAAYDEIGDLRRFIDRLATDKALFPGKIWLDEGGPTPVVYIQRAVPPWNREAYDATDDPVMKRYHACFCSMVRDAIRTGEPVSEAFCNCSGGWFVQMWQAILDRRLRIDVVESVLRGDDRCLFAIHIPPQLL